MFYKVTYVPTGDSLHARSEFGAFSALSWLCDFHELSPGSLLADYWEILHDFPSQMVASYGDFTIESFPGDQIE